MHRGEAVPSKLEFTLGPETRTDERHVLVEANVYPVWWNKGVGGRLSYNGLPRSWRFTARESSLWQIVRVERAIVQVYDRMLCVLYGSRHSRSWLEFEVEAAGGSRCSSSADRPGVASPTMSDPRAISLLVGAAPLASMSMSDKADAPPSRRDTIGTVALIAAILGVFGLICLPTRIQDLAPALRAKLSHGITGTFRLDEYRSGKTGYWHGEFRSHDGRVVIRSTKLDGLPASTPAGSNVPAFIVTTRHTFWGPPTAYTGKNSNYLWLPVLATLYWSSLIVAGTIWIRIALRRRRLKRFPPPPPQTHLPPPDPGNVRAIGMRLRRPRIEHPRDE